MRSTFQAKHINDIIEDLLRWCCWCQYNVTLLVKVTCQLKLNWQLKWLEMYIELTYTKTLIETWIDVCTTQSRSIC
jgi:hypothetical protein